MTGKRCRKTRADYRRRQRARKSEAGPIALEKLRELRRTQNTSEGDHTADRLYYTSLKRDAKLLENFPVTGDSMDHLKAALNRKHPFETGITLPLSLEAAIETQLSLTPDEIIRRRKLTMEAIKKRAVALESATTTSQASMHSDVAKIAGNLNLDLLEELIDLTEYPDRALVEDLRNGMPVVGHITVSPGVFAPPRPPMDSDGKERVISLDELHSRARSARAGIINSIREEGFKAEVWEGTLQEVEKGHLEGPLQLAAIESSFENPVIVRRFPVHQSDKTRLCDDYKRSHTNLATSFGQRVTLPTHQTLIGAWRRLSRAADGCNFQILKGDHENAYRQVPTHPDHAQYQLICIADPDNKPAIFRHRAASFGSSSSVTSYCRVSQCLVHLLRVLFCLAAMSFIDDYWSVERSETSPSAFECWIFLNEVIGFREKVTKRTPPSNDIDLLGLGVKLDRESLTLSLPEEKRISLETLMRELSQVAVPSPGRIRKLCGKLTFASATSGDFPWRASIRRLHAQLWGRRDPKKLADDLQQLSELLSEAPFSRVFPMKPPTENALVIYSDAEGAKGRLGAVLCFGSETGKKNRYFSEIADSGIVGSWKQRATQIVPLELLAALVAIRTFASSLKGRTAWLYVDSEPVKHALIRGSSGQNDLNDMVKEFWRLVSRKGVNLWISRVPSAQNLADGPSRHDFSLVRSFSRVPAVWPSLYN